MILGLMATMLLNTVFTCIYNVACYDAYSWGNYYSQFLLLFSQKRILIKNILLHKKIKLASFCAVAHIIERYLLF